MSIQHLPTAVAFANRAAAYLKIGAYLQAENDCTEAFKLDDQYMKAYARRTMARKELGKLIEAKEDAEICLKLDPGLKDIQKLQAEIGSLLKKVKVTYYLLLLFSYGILPSTNTCRYLGRGSRLGHFLRRYVVFTLFFNIKIPYYSMCIVCPIHMQKRKSPCNTVVGYGSILLCSWANIQSTPLSSVFKSSSLKP